MKRKTLRDACNNIAAIQVRSEYSLPPSGPGRYNVTPIALKIYYAMRWEVVWVQAARLDVVQPWPAETGDMRRSYQEAASPWRNLTLLKSV